MGEFHVCVCVPNQFNSALLINFLLSSDAEIFVNNAPTEHTKLARNVQKKKTVHATCTCSDTELSLLHATVGGWVE